MKKRLVEVYATFGGSTNEFAKLGLKMEEGDRRMIVYEANRHAKIGNKAFFADIQRLCVDPSVRKYMAKYWLGLDLTGFDPLNERPRTALYEQALRASLPAEVLFLAHVAESWSGTRTARAGATRPSHRAGASAMERSTHGLRRGASRSRRASDPSLTRRSSSTSCSERLASFVRDSSARSHCLLGRTTPSRTSAACRPAASALMSLRYVRGWSCAGWARRRSRLPRPW